MANMFAPLRKTSFDKQAESLTIFSEILAALFLVMAIGSTFSGCDSSTSPTPASGVNIPTPTGWTRKDNVQMSSSTADFTLTSPSGASGYSAEIAVISTPTSAGLALDQVGPKTALSLQSSSAFTSVILDSNIATSVGGLPGQKVQLRYTMAFGTTTLTFLDQLLLAVKDGKLYDIQFLRVESDKSMEAVMHQAQAALTWN